MIDASVTGDERVIASIRSQYQKVITNVEQSIGRLTLKLLTRVKVNKLSGQVLNVRTGRLRRSITYVVNKTPSRITGIVGTNVEYARAHELGFSGEVSVKAHLRRTKTEKKLFIRGAKAGQVNTKQTLRDQKAKSPTILVKAHTRKVNLPEKSFLRSALSDMALDYSDSTTIS